eukprot:TRINITY_DN3924_c0_g1_i5.p5 TRINITY_DN3924_c0_g1~~TRINITY_DN3924_c0_g1_i5.p5  ORF type:complete len:103 (+),score=16.92 TRINITY_DN3924_c0_g1_i5:345-653(+)
MTIETSAHIMIKMSKTRNKNANKQQKLCLQIEVKININSTKMAPKGINPPKRQILTHVPVSYTHLRAHETGRNLVCRLLLEKKKKQDNEQEIQIQQTKRTDN